MSSALVVVRHTIVAVEVVKLLLGMMSMHLS